MNEERACIYSTALEAFALFWVKTPTRLGQASAWTFCWSGDCVCGTPRPEILLTFQGQTFRKRTRIHTSVVAWRAAGLQILAKKPQENPATATPDLSKRRFFPGVSWHMPNPTSDNKQVFFCCNCANFFGGGGNCQPQERKSKSEVRPSAYLAAAPRCPRLQKEEEWRRILINPFYWQKHLQDTF